MTKTITITGENLRIEDVVKIARDNYEIKLSELAKKNISRSRKVVDKLVSLDEVVYGITTGFGSLSNVKIDKEKTKQLQKNLIMSHACGVGDPFSEEVVRAIIVLRVNTFAKGYSGIRLSTVNLLIEMLNKKVYPYVPSKGSVGSSGDLAPLSHIILVMMGMGECIVNGKRVNAKEELKRKKISPISLTSKEGLALNNGTPVMTAIGLLTVYDSYNVFRHSIISSCLSMEGLVARKEFLDSKVHEARPQLGQIIVAKSIRNMLKDSKLINSDLKKVQDSYSIRATPVVLGASLDALNYVKEKVEIEINSATDNPLIIEEKAYSAANFHGQPMALAFDFLAIALSEIANLCERRIARLVDSNLNEGLSSFLVKDSGVNSGFMIPQYTTAALVSENKVLSHPASVDSIPTCANQEDHVSMGTISARKAKEVLDNVVRVVGIEIMIATQAVELRDKKPSSKIEEIVRVVRSCVAKLEEDRVLYKDMEKIENVIKKRSIFKKTNIEIELR